MTNVFRASIVAATLCAASTVSDAAPSDEQVREILRQRIEVHKQGVGIVVGIIEPAGSRVVAYGSLSRDDSRQVTGDTIFEIGSITKVFTALLLADMAKKGEVRLEDPLNSYLPEGVRSFSRPDGPITLVQLATHTSGLPRMPANFLPSDPMDPYADYSTDQLHRFITRYAPIDAVGPSYEYSNLGFGLLAGALTTRSTMEFDSLVRNRISEPLKLADTAVAVRNEARSRLALGHDDELNVVPNWKHTSAMIGAGGLYSTADDLMRFLSAYLGGTSSPLEAAMDSMFETRKPTYPDSENALGWQIYSKGGREIAWKNGGTGGYRSYIGMDRQARVAVVVLSNASTQSGVDDIGRHILDSNAPLARPPRPREHVSLETSVLDQYVGEYEARQGYIVSVARDGSRLIVRVPGETPLKLLTQSPGKFQLGNGAASITFAASSEGPAPQLVIHSGSEMPAQRITTARAEQLRADFTRRVREQIPASRSEALVRQQIETIVKEGIPHFEDMSPSLKRAVESSWPQTKTAFVDVGQFRSIKLAGVASTGIDIFRVDFANRVLEWRIGVSADGKIAEMWWRPVQPKP